jgi:hypothetical protein
MEKYYDFTIIPSDGGDGTKTALAILRRETEYFNHFKPKQHHVSPFDSTVVNTMLRVIISRVLPDLSIKRLFQLLAAFQYYKMNFQMKRFAKEVEKVRTELDEDMIKFIIENVPYYIGRCFRCKELGTWNKITEVLAFCDIKFDANELYGYLRINMPHPDWFKALKQLLVFKLQVAHDRDTKEQYISVLTRIGGDSLKDRVLNVVMYTADYDEIHALNRLDIMVQYVIENF